MTTTPLTFATFTPGEIIGSAPVTLDQRLFDLWAALYPNDSHTDASGALLMPAGMTAVLLMNAYATILTPRPPGNIHAGQRFDIHRLPAFGDTVITELRCTSKVLKKDRRWIDFDSQSRAESGELLFSGNMTIIWAA